MTVNTALFLLFTSPFLFTYAFSTRSFSIARNHFTVHCQHRRRLQLNLDGSDNEDTPTNQELIPNDLGLEIIRGGGDEMSDETWRNIEEGAPSKVDVMKNLLGINIFTYILAILIIFFLSMNTIYGLGWFGQLLGMEGVGTFTRVSDSLPIDVDVSGKEFLL
ncbi:hypothetical protein ACHAWO_005070 [Cyclotella atomus]|uniref:Uncharacterized protein n=1 Tax=Cyclotella atomus TaxID=382360 RepID=A0ABD3P7E4_9STRA